MARIEGRHESKWMGMDAGSPDDRCGVRGSRPAEGSWSP